MSRAKSVPMVLSPTCFDGNLKTQLARRVLTEGLYVPLRKRGYCAAQCAVCIVHCALCTVLCAVCTVHALCSVHCATPLVPWERARPYYTNAYVWAKNFSWRSGPGVFLLNHNSSRNPCRPSLSLYHREKYDLQVCGSSP
jgi:hypothetical protein